MSHAPFRQDATGARPTQWLGDTRIGWPESFTISTFSSVALASARIAVACWREAAKKTTARGLPSPRGGVVHVTAMQSGVVTELMAHEGEDVAASQPIAHVRTERIMRSGDAGVLPMQVVDARRPSLHAERYLTDQGLRQRQDALAQRNHRESFGIGSLPLCFQ